MNENARIAANLLEAAEWLDRVGGKAFSAAAYRRAADVLRKWPRPVHEIYARGGLPGLKKLPGVGRGIASAIAEMLVTGRWLRLERMRSERSFIFAGNDGVEHESVVIEARPPRRVPGREAIVKLLRQDR
jgi:DNA polymerase/3'-5' exonuclease PolX